MSISDERAESYWIAGNDPLADDNVDFDEDDYEAGKSYGDDPYHLYDYDDEDQCEENVADI